MLKVLKMLPTYNENLILYICVCVYSFSLVQNGTRLIPNRDSKSSEPLDDDNQ